MLYTPSRNQSAVMSAPVAPISRERNTPSHNPIAHSFDEDYQQYAPTLQEGVYRKSPGEIAMASAWLNTWPLIAFIMVVSVLFTMMGASFYLILSTLFFFIPVFFMRMAVLYVINVEKMKNLYRNG